MPAEKKRSLQAGSQPFVTTRSLSFNLGVVRLGFGFLLWYYGQQKYFGMVSEKGWSQRLGDSAVIPCSLHPFKPLVLVNKFFFPSFFLFVEYFCELNDFPPDTSEYNI